MVISFFYLLTELFWTNNWNFDFFFQLARGPDEPQLLTQWSLARGPGFLLFVTTLVRPAGQTLKITSNQNVDKFLNCWLIWTNFDLKTKNLTNIDLKKSKFGQSLTKFGLIITFCQFMTLNPKRLNNFDSFDLKTETLMLFYLKTVKFWPILTLTP